MLRQLLRTAPLLWATLCATPALASFHLNEINKIMVGFNGDQTIQAVEIKMLAGGENLVGTATIKVYDANGMFVSTLGTFAGSVPNGVAGRKILCATANFASTFGITPDLVISSGLPVTTGQVSFELGTCLINAIPYGAIIVPKNGSSAAPPIPKDGATVLVRTVDNVTTFFCPPQEDANAKFLLTSGNSGSPVAFTNNSNASVNVFTTVTAADGATPGVGSIHAYPNPIRGSARVEAPAWAPLTVHDVLGRLVRVLTCTGACPAIAGPFRGVWDGTDDQGQRLPSGIYFIRYVGAPRPEIKRVVLLR